MDYADDTTLTAALKDQQCLVITLSIFTSAGSHRKLIAAGARAGVPHMMSDV